MSQDPPSTTLLSTNIIRPSEKLPLTEACLHYNDSAEVPDELQKYWWQRYKIWKHYDYDIRMTNDAWFGVTPELIANKIAEELATKCPPSVKTVIDIFGGAGGSAIALAMSGHWENVIVIEKDADTLACAQHNAEVYEVGEYITWVQGDCFEFLAALQTAASLPLALVNGGQLTRVLDDSLLALCGLGASARQASPTAVIKTVQIFASPPWGGVTYGDEEVFDLEMMKPYNLTDIHSACGAMAHALYLPRTSDLRQLAKLAKPTTSRKGQPKMTKLDVCQYCINGASKAMVAYIPACR